MENNNNMRKAERNIKLFWQAMFVSWENPSLIILAHFQTVFEFKFFIYEKRIENGFEFYLLSFVSYNIPLVRSISICSS